MCKNKHNQIQILKEEITTSISKFYHILHGIQMEVYQDFVVKKVKYDYFIFFMRYEINNESYFYNHILKTISKTKFCLLS